MNNLAVARIFARIADLLEIRGDNPFKIRAYRQAAQTIQELTESLEALAERGELRAIPGVGEAIAAKTLDILATGTTPLYERLRAEVPEGLVELLALPGLGPKRIRTLHEALGVRNLDELERAAREGRVRQLPGFSAKSEAALLAAIEAHRRRHARWPLYRALPYAEALQRMLAATDAVDRVEIAGALRRMVDEVEEIRLAARAEAPEAAIQAFLRLPECPRVLERGPARARVETAAGIPALLEAAPAASFGTLLWSATGSPTHLERLRARAARLGLHPPDSTPVAEEAEVYDRLGLPWIPPELREGRGEIDAAEQGRLPRPLRPEDLRGILHAHSTWTDGADTIADMAAAARRLGYAYHGNTDHSRALRMVRGLDEERLRAQMAEIDALNAGFADGFRILKGIECDILADGSLDLEPNLLRQLDLVVGSVHSHLRQDRETMTRRVVRALESGLVDLLAHPTGRILGARDPSALEIDAMLDAAETSGAALEMNASPDRLDLSAEHARLARDRGIPLALNTDAHRAGELSALRYGIAQARRAWVEPEHLLNAWPAERLLEWLRERRARS